MDEENHSVMCLSLHITSTLTQWLCLVTLAILIVAGSYFLPQPQLLPRSTKKLNSRFKTVPHTKKISSFSSQRLCSWTFGTRTDCGGNGVEFVNESSLTSRVWRTCSCEVKGWLVSQLSRSASMTSTFAVIELSSFSWVFILFIFSLIFTRRTSFSLGTSMLKWKRHFLLLT